MNVQSVPFTVSFQSEPGRVRLSALHARLEERTRQLGRAEAERDALRARALAAEEREQRERQRREAAERALEDERRTPWWRRLWLLLARGSAGPVKPKPERRWG